MPEGWKSLRWGEVCELKYGKAVPKDCDCESHHVPVLGTSGIFGWTCKPLSKGPRVIVGRKGTLGVQLAKSDFWTVDTAFWLEESASLDPIWAYYRLKQIDFRNENSGSAVPSLTREHFYSMSLDLPPLEDQRRIAMALSAFDDLIEVNRGLIKDLESLTHAKFLQKLAELGTESGTCSLASTVEILSGGTPKTSEPAFWGGAIPWFSVVDSPADSETWVLETEKSITEEGLKGSSAKIIPVGATILTARGTVGKTALVGLPMAINQSCYALRCRTGGLGYFNYYRVRSAIDSLQRMSHGSVFSTITRDTLDSVQVPVVSDADIRAFDSQVDPYLQQIRALVEENMDLASTRDELLPLLLSGRLSAHEGVAA